MRLARFYFCLCLLFCGALQMGQLAAAPQLLAEEAFNDASGLIVGAAGGIVWSGAWINLDSQL